MPVVSNTGPLIALAKIDQLGLLPQLFSTVSIPPAVHRELMAKSGIEMHRLNAALAKYIAVTAEPEFSPAAKFITRHLEAGEQEAIALAEATKTVLIIDEKLGRQAAQRLGLAVSGSAGVLIKAKQQGLIPAVKPLLEAARRRGYWLSDELLSIAAKLAGENM